MDRKNKIRVTTNCDYPELGISLSSYCPDLLCAFCGECMGGVGFYYVGDRICESCFNLCLETEERLLVFCARGGRTVDEIKQELADLGIPEEHSISAFLAVRLAGKIKYKEASA